MMPDPPLVCRWWKKDEPAPGPEDFHKTVLREIEEWNACVKTQGKAKCVRLYNPQQVGGGREESILTPFIVPPPSSLRPLISPSACQGHVQRVPGRVAGLLPTGPAALPA